REILCGRLRLILRDLDQRKNVGVDDFERGFGAQLAAQQPHGFLVGVDVFAAAGDEAGDEHSLERRDIQLGLNRRLDRDLQITCAAGKRGGGQERGRRGERQSTCCLCRSRLEERR